MDLVTYDMELLREVKVSVNGSKVTFEPLTTRVKLKLFLLTLCTLMKTWYLPSR